MRPMEEIHQAIAKSVEQRDELRKQLRDLKRDFEPLSADLTDVAKAKRQIEKYLVQVLEIKDLEIEQAMTLGTLTAYYDCLGYDNQEILDLQSDSYWMGSTDEPSTKR